MRDHQRVNLHAARRLSLCPPRAAALAAMRSLPLGRGDLERSVAAQSCPCPDICVDQLQNGCLVGPTDYCTYSTGCPLGEYQSGTCCYTCPSPIIIDVANDGFELTNVASGVWFPIGPSSFMYKVAWTYPDSDDAWLALDRDGNGTIDNGQELFGNFTPQPEPPPGQAKHGFLALAAFDNPTKGGNNDRVIDNSDSIYSSLRLWQDRNHNGVSEPRELHTLPSLGIVRISLDFKESSRRDEFGNRFHYRAKVYGAANGDSGRWAYDVFLRIATRFPSR